MEYKDNPVEKVVIDEEELDGMEIDNILGVSSESSRWWRRAY